MKITNEITLVLKHINVYEKNNLVKLSPTEKKVNMKVSGGGLMDTFTVGQMHLHWAKNDQAFGNGGSEHLLNSMRFWGELHVVCFNDKYTEDHLSQPDGLAVLGFFVDVSLIYTNNMIMSHNL